MQIRRTFHKSLGPVAVAFAITLLALFGGGTGTAAAQQQTGQTEATQVTATNAHPGPVRLFAQAGPGLVEIAHLEVGTFLGPHVSIEATAAWAAVFGARYGAGAFYTFGYAQGKRPPRHGLLLGARLMLDSGANFNTHGDDLSSYGVIPVGYAFLSDRGFFFRATVGAAIVREETRRDGPTPLMPIVEHKWGVGGPLFTASFGFAWDGT